MACLSWSSWPPRPFQEVDERNAKLLQTLSEATDMLAKADEMQVLRNTRIRSSFRRSPPLRWAPVSW